MAPPKTKISFTRSDGTPVTFKGSPTPTTKRTAAQIEERMKKLGMHEKLIANAIKKYTEARQKAKK